MYTTDVVCIPYRWVILTTAMRNTETLIRHHIAQSVDRRTTNMVAIYRTCALRWRISRIRFQIAWDSQHGWQSKTLSASLLHWWNLLYRTVAQIIIYFTDQARIRVGNPRTRYSTFRSRDEILRVSLYIVCACVRRGIRTASCPANEWKRIVRNSCHEHAVRSSTDTYGIQVACAIYNWEIILCLKNACMWYDIGVALT